MQNKELFQIDDEVVLLRDKDDHKKGTRFVIKCVLPDCIVVDYVSNDSIFSGASVYMDSDYEYKNISLDRRIKDSLPKVVKEKTEQVKPSVLNIILTLGISGSGKSTWAKEQVLESKGKTIQVTKDDIRFMLYGHEKNSEVQLSKGQENFVQKVRDSVVIDALESGMSVILADTNLHPKHEARMKEIAEEFTKANPLVKVNVKIKSFIDVPIETCIKNDLKRTHSLGEKILRGQYKQYLNWNGLGDASVNNKKFVPLKQDTSLKASIIVDLDGTTSLFKDVYQGTDENGKHIHNTLRNPYNAEDCHLDVPNKFVIDLVNMYKSSGHTVLFVSGRKSIYRERTVEFLNSQFNWCQEHNPEFHLYMRGNDSRADTIIKREIFDTYIRDKYNVVTCVDDRDSVVSMWRYTLGLNVLQVAEGSF